MPQATFKVVVDTNVWISFLIGRSLKGLDRLLLDGSIRLLFCDELMAELLEVLHRPKFSKYFTSQNIEELVELIRQLADWVEPTQQVDECRDPKDNFLLDLCLVGGADYLITGDQDLLVLNPFKETQIVHYRNFLESVKNNRDS
jgi:putative PIN family toxin of toxin-antitoxin system